MKALADSIPDTYRELAEILIPRPIHNGREYKRAVKIIGELAPRDDLNRDQEDYLEALSVFVEAYEEAHHPIGLIPITPLEGLKLLLEESGMNASDLGRLLGNRALGSAILRGERGLSKANILRLADHFKIDPGYFLRL